MDKVYDLVTWPRMVSFVRTFSANKYHSHATILMNYCLALVLDISPPPGTRPVSPGIIFPEKTSYPCMQTPVWKNNKNHEQVGYTFLSTRN